MEIAEKYPGDFLCADFGFICESEEEKSNKITQSEVEKMDKKCLITVTEDVTQTDADERINELEKENKKLKLELSQFKELKKELKRERESKQKIIADRKIEVARLNKTIEQSKLEMSNINRKCEILENEKNILEITTSNDKILWNEELHTKLKESSEKIHLLKVKNQEMHDKYHSQYISVIQEKDNAIKEKDIMIEEKRQVILQQKAWLDELDKERISVKQKDEHIKNLEKSCEILTKENESVNSINQTLEKQIHAVKIDKNFDELMGDSNNEMPMRLQNKQGGNKRANADEDDLNGRGKRTRIDKDKNRQTVHQYEESQKVCYACGSSDHEVKHCHKKCNIYVKYKGTDKWLNRTGVENVFRRYGRINMTRIQRDWYGEELRSAMVCFEEEDSAEEAIEDMQNDSLWDVKLYQPKQRSNHRENKTIYSGMEKQDRYRNMYGRDNQQQHQVMRNMSTHWTRTNANFFGIQKDNDDFPSLTSQRKGKDLEEDVFQLKKDISTMAIQLKGISDMMSKLRYSA